MASGFTVMDMLNKSSKTEKEGPPKARFRTKDISIFKMYRNEMNFYKISDIEELAGDILMYGLKQNLEVAYKPCESGEYRIVSGERRWEALKTLVEKGYDEFEMATCKLTTPQDDEEEQLEIISANAYRTKRIADILEEEQRLKKALESMKAAGKKIKGHSLDSGRLRDVVASMMGISRTKVAQIESVNKNLIPEFKEELNKEQITFSAAYELSGMLEEEQKKAYESYQSMGCITHKDVKSIKKRGKAAVQQEDDESVQQKDEKTESVSEYDTEESMSFEDAHPESITSLCYSCKRYADCNVKTGTCKRCDQYINKTEAEKTEEQRYYEEQERIDIETRKKLREIEDEEKMNHLPSDIQGTPEQDSMEHKMRMSVNSFESVWSGERKFELCRKDSRYKIDDILVMEEYREGIQTGRALKAMISYIMEDCTGLEEGYCILALEVLGGVYWDKNLA